jgi:hypothetical protein
MISRNTRKNDGFSPYHDGNRDCRHSGTGLVGPFGFYELSSLESVHQGDIRTIHERRIPPGHTDASRKSGHDLFPDGAGGRRGKGVPLAGAPGRSGTVRRGALFPDRIPESRADSVDPWRRFFQPSSGNPPFLDTGRDYLLSLEQHIRQLEEELLCPEVRSSLERMEAVLAEDFLEIGLSGRIYDKKQVLQALLSEPEVHYEMMDFTMRPLAGEVLLVTYRTIRQEAPENPQVHSLRSSIWKKIEDRWQMVFHQGTSQKGPMKV